MSFFRKPIATLLEREQEKLDTIFGEKAFQIKSLEKDHAILETKMLAIDFGRDTRDGDIAALITLREPDWDFESMAHPAHWARFLGEEEKAKDRNHNGHILASDEGQIKSELDLISRIVKEIFSDEQKTRDAAHWVEGYTEAYNDCSSGAWDE